jgi:hypothetical protein
MIGSMFRKAMIGDGSTLNLDFTTMTATADLTARGLTFTRGSTGTRINASGFVETMSNNVARFDHDPTTGAPRGLLVEGQVSNIVTYSGDLTQNGAGHWSGRTNLVTTNWTGFTAPDNTASAVKIIPDTTSGRHTIENNAPNIVNGTTYTASAFVKADGYTVASLVVAGGQARRNFTLTGAGSLGSQFGATNTATIDPVGTQGWYRVTMTWTSTTTGSVAFWIGVPQNATTDVVSSWSGNGTSAIQAWGAQLETGSGASSYIPTGASQATRNVDICTMSNIAALNYNANGGTLFAHFSNNNENANFAGSIGFNNGANYAQRFRWGSGTLLASYFQTNGTTALGSNLAGSRTSFASAKAATSYSFDGTTTSTAMSINGAQASTTPTSSAVSGVSIATAFALNSDNSSAATAYPSIAIRSVKFYPTALTMAQMNAITANP